MEMENGPLIWRAILEPVHAAIGSGVIAGGAVRDHFIGCKPKDFDIFVNTRTAANLEGAVPRLAEAGFSLELMDHTEYEDAPDWVSAVTGVLDGYWHDLPVQIIGRPAGGSFGGAQLVGNFDFAITQCWFDGTLNDTPQAEADRNRKVVTLTRWNSPEHIAVSFARFERFNARHDGAYTLIDGRTGEPAIAPPIPEKEEIAF